jgi:Ca-activated chloride channel family protein
VTFGRPWLLLALLAVPLLAWLYVRVQRRRSRYAVNFTNLAVLRDVARAPAWRRFVPAALFLLALAALTAGVARPHVRGLVPQERATVVLVLDVSRSMEARDVRPNRIGAAKEAIRLFLERAPERLRIGLVVFAGIPQVVTPPTRDREQVSVSLDHLGEYATFGGTAIGDALSMAVEVGQDTLERDAAEAPTTGGAADGKLVSILFLSDGAQHQGVLQPLEGAALAKQAGMRVYTVALGTPSGTVPGFGGGQFGGGGGGGGFFEPERIPVPPDPVTLNAIAEETGGEFTDARTAEALTKAYEALGSSLGRTEQDKEVTYAFLLAAAGLLLAAGVLSSLWASRLP